MKLLNRKQKSEARQSGWNKFGSKKSMFLSAVVLVLVLIAGYIGVAYWQVGQLKAKASGYTLVANSGGHQIWLCKRRFDGGAYGPLFTVNAIMHRYTSATRSGTIVVAGGERSTSGWVFNYATLSSSVGSLIRGDTIHSYMYLPGYGTVADNRRSPGSIADC